MPPGRPRGRPAKNTTSSTANAAAAAPQSRLSFGPRNAANKITKPAATTHSQSPKDKKLSPKQKRAIEDTATAELAKTQISEPSSSSSDHDDNKQQAATPATRETDTQPAEQQQKSQSPNKNKPLPIRPSGAGADLANASKLGPRDMKEVEASKVSEAQIKKYWKRKEDDRIAARVHQRGLSVHEKVLREFDLSSQFGPCIGIPRLNRWKRADGLGLKPPLEVLAVLMKEEGLERAYVDELMGKTLGGLDA